MKNNSIIEAHDHSIRHRKEIQNSEICGCFFCLSIFEPSEVDEWIDDDQTAMCPKCGLDSVIGSESGFPITESFLKKMYDHWF